MTTVGEAEDERARLEKQAVAAFERHDYAEAERLLRELVPLDHENFVPWYNLACALSMQGKLDESATMLRQSIQRGFADKPQLERDEQLTALRATDAYAAIVADWNKSVSAADERRIERLKAKYRVGAAGSPYTFELDEARRLAFITAFDPTLFTQAKAEIERLSTWWERQVLPPISTSPDAAGPVPIVSVLLPTRADYRLWAKERFGDLWDRIGGSYSHDEHALVAMDLGSSMRHEYWHVLHWRHMESLHQRHPLWVMEGLCSLVEDVDVGPTGEMIPRPSWRTNVARKIAQVGRPTPWADLFAMDRKHFIGTRPLARYAESRAIFLYLSEKGKLREWYGAYITTYPEDPTGLAAFARVFGRPAKEIEKDFRIWCRALPQVPDEVGRMAANLPVDLDNGKGDGVLVVSDPAMEAFMARGAAAEEAGKHTGELRKGDVITAVGGKPVRDLNDLTRALAEHEPGRSLEVALTRRGQHKTTTVVLVPPR